MSQKTRVPAAPEAKSSSSVAKSEKKKEASAGAHVLKGHQTGSASGDSSPNNSGRRVSTSEFRRTSFQAKLRLGSVDDPLEKEADAVADQVVDGKPPARPMPRANWKVNSQAETNAGAKASTPVSGKPATPVPAAPPAPAPVPAPSTAPVSKISRAKKTVEEDPEEVVDADTEQRIAGLSGAGEPLPNRSFFEQRMGRDFSDVRIHRGAEAAELTRRTHARAFTVGKNIVFGPGEFAPASRAGKKLIAHELTHVVQQGASGVSLQRRERPPGSGPGGVQGGGSAAASTSATRAAPGTAPISAPAGIGNAAGPESSSGSITPRESTSGPSPAESGGGEGPVGESTGTGSSSPGGGSATAKEREKNTAAISGGEPAEVLKQLESTPPTGIIGAFNQAKAAAASNAGERVTAEQAALPVIPAPTGMPAGPRPAKPSISRRRRAVPKSFRGFKSDRRRRRKYSTKVVLPKDGRKTPTRMGARPKVDQSGAADPRQLTNARRDSENIVTAEKNHAMLQANKDFGESKIRPAPDKSVLSARNKLKNRKLKLPGDIADPGITAEMREKIDANVGPGLRGAIRAQREKGEKADAEFRDKRDAAHQSAEKRMAKLKSDARESQQKEISTASGKVKGLKTRWRGELKKVNKKYRTEARTAAGDQLGKIKREQRKGESEADRHFNDAESKAKTEKNSALDKIKKLAGGVLDFLGDTAKTVTKGIQKAINFIFDALRKAVKIIFENAKKLALVAIETSRVIITGYIKAYAFILKKIIAIALAHFPRLAGVFNRLIDAVVEAALAAVNKIAAVMKKAVTVVLDFLAKQIDALIEIYQKIYSGVFELLHMLISGEFAEVMKRLGYLAEAAKRSPGFFEQAALEEVTGADLNKPLTPEELSAIPAEVVEKLGFALPASVPAGPGDSGDGETKGFPEPPYNEKNVGVEPVLRGSLSPELLKDAEARKGPDGTVEFGESDDPSRSLESMRDEVEGKTSDPAVGKSPAKPASDGLTPVQRGKVKWEMMKHSLFKWISDNAVAITLGVIGAIAVIAAAIIFSGGAILAALAPVLAVLGKIMVGVAIFMIAKPVTKYLELGWNNKIDPAAHQLAKALAIGAIEIISLITFKAAGAALKGAKTVARGAVRAASTSRRLARLAGGGRKFFIRGSKVVFNNVKKSFFRGIRTLRVLGRRLLRRFRLKKFRIRFQGRRFFLEGFINPWVLILTGDAVGSHTVDQAGLDQLAKGKKATPGSFFTIEGTSNRVLVLGDDPAANVKRISALINDGTVKLTPKQIEKLKSINALEASKIKPVTTKGKPVEAETTKPKTEPEVEAPKKADEPGASATSSEPTKIEVDPRIANAKTAADLPPEKLAEFRAQFGTAKLTAEIRGPIEKIKQLNPAVRHIPSELLAAVRGYTGGIFRTLNKALRSGLPEKLKEVAEYIEFAVGGLRRLEKYTGPMPLIRRVRSREMPPEVVRQLKEGEDFTDPAFFSTSKADAKPKFDGDIEMVILEQSSGRRVDFLSKTESELEVLFEPGTKWLIKKRYTKGGVKGEILVVELVEDVIKSSDQ